MRTLDWIILIASLVFIVTYGVYKGRGSKNITSFILADRSMRWYTVLFSIMATQASAITFLSTPGQAYVDGMRFVQFYLGLPVAMIVLSITAIPIYHKLNVYTAYEYLEKRFDSKTRTFAALLFLIQRGLATGLTIFAPSLIFSTILGWPIFWTNLIIGVLVIIYTTSGGSKAVQWTHFQQMIIIMSGMLIAFVMILRMLPESVSLLDATRVAGFLGKMNVIDFQFDPDNRYNFWSGLLGGFFLQLSYFGTDQSQVGRYLTGQSITQSRLGLLFNGLVKIPMQFFILFIGVMVFVFYQFQAPPVFFNPVPIQATQESGQGQTLFELQELHDQAFERKRQALINLVDAMENGTEEAIKEARLDLQNNREQVASIRNNAVTVMQRVMPDMDTKDTNYIFLSFITEYMPVGLVGLLLAAIVAASMSSTSAELNALASTSVVDIYRRFFKGGRDEKRALLASRLSTVLWGAFAIFFAEYAARLGSLIEAVNILGSLFYGTILGIFLVAFYIKWVQGTQVFLGAILAEIAVVLIFLFTDISFLWYNVIGCLGVVTLSILMNAAVLWKKD